MKARVENGQIKVYKSLPSEYKKADGSVILNFRKASVDVLEAEGFYDVVKPSYDSQIQTRGGLYFDEAASIVTYAVTDIDFNQDVDVLDENGDPTGETEKRYKIADIKAEKLAEIKSKAGELLKPTDWQVIRKMERNIDIDLDVATERADILAEADRLEAEVNAKKSYKTVLQYQVRFFPPSEEEVI